MSRKEIVQECDRALQDLLPDLPRPEQKALAGLVCGVVLEQNASLSRASAAIPGPAQDRSKQRRAQRLLANPRLEVARAQRRLLGRILRQRRGRLDLLLDATTTGATAHQAGTVTLCLAVGWQGRALPLLWRTWPARQRGQDWKGAIQELFATVQAELPPDVQVVVLADRGLAGGPLARACSARGWHYLLRIQGTTRIRHADGMVQLIRALVPHVGTASLLTGSRVFAPRRNRGHWVALWEEALVTNVVAVWPAGQKEAWLLVTDLPARVTRCTEYRHRTWEEELFRDLKSFGWGWQKSRVRRPERVERLLLVLALATLWVVCQAQRVVRRGWRYLVEERSRRCYSCFQLGLRWLKRLLANDQPVHCLLHLWPQARAPLKLS